MGMEDDRRGIPGRRDYDSASAEWRGRISEQVRAHDHRLTALDVDLRGVSEKLGGVEQSLVRVHGRLDDVQEAVGDAAGRIDKQREAELASLKGSITRVIVYLLFPLIVVVVGGLILLLVTGKHP